jgi:eight-cysteine-cluster-containing protein
MQRGKFFLPLLLSVLVVASSGCISDPTAFAKAIPMVNDFLKEHPNAELSIVHYSTSEAEDILEQVKEDCGKLTVEAKEYYFVNLTDPSTGLVVRAWIDWENRIVECVYKEGIIVDPENCTSLHRSACFGDHVYWFDSCGNREEKKEYCPLGCSNGECIKEGEICEVDKSYREKPNCSCPEGYEMMVLYLRCVDSITGAITGMPVVVTDATAAEAVTVESGAVQISPEFTTDFELRCPGEGPIYRCVKRERCRSHAQSMCYRGHVYWFDSCGHVQEKKEYCESGCENGFCKERRTCEEMGGYCIYPTAASGGGGGSTSTANTGATASDSVTGMVNADTTTSSTVCREGYERASYYCPDNGVCCAPVKEECKSQYEHRCYEGHVYWYDSCGNRESKREYCEHGCENGECIQEQGFCGTSTYTECASDEDCAAGGCSGQICEASDEGTVTTCEYRDCYNAAQYGLECGCYGGKCQWYEACYESDEGYDIYNKGACEKGETRLEDHCNNDGTLTEKYCEGGEIVAKSAECPGGFECSEGACVEVEAECVPEGEYMQGTVSPEYQTYCCEGLEGFDTSGGLLGAPLLCYDPQKGEPVCMHAGTGDEGWYYSATEEMILVADCQEVDCRNESYQCTIEDIECCPGLVEVPMAAMENGTCIAANCGSVCRPCGDGVCADNENYCSCPEDCV